MTESQITPFSMIRKKIAEVVTNSKLNVPHFYVQADIDMTRVMEMHKNWDVKYGEKPSINHFILKATAMALTAVPELNVSHTAEGILKHEAVNLGFAVSQEGGMLIPVIRNAEKLSLSEIAEAARLLAQKAKGRRLMPQEYSGGTFTVSNMGMMGVKAFAAIIPPPQAGILAVGKTEAVPGWDGFSWQPVWKAAMTISADHRVVDGGQAAQFLQELNKILGNPEEWAYGQKTGSL